MYSFSILWSWCNFTNVQKQLLWEIRGQAKILEHECGRRKSVIIQLSDKLSNVRTGNNQIEGYCYYLVGLHTKLMMLLWNFWVDIKAELSNYGIQVVLKLAMSPSMWVCQIKLYSWEVFYNGSSALKVIKFKFYYVIYITIISM